MTQSEKIELEIQSIKNVQSLKKWMKSMWWYFWCLKWTGLKKCLLFLDLQWTDIFKERWKYKFLNLYGKQFVLYNYTNVLTIWTCKLTSRNLSKII